MKVFRVFNLRLLFLIVVLIFLLNCEAKKPKVDTNGMEPPPLVSQSVSQCIDDFDRCAPSNNCLNGATGSYHYPERFPGNDLKETFNETVVSSGCALKLTYDVTARKGFVGYWSKLNGADFSKYKKLVLDTMGDFNEGFTTRFKIELKPFTGGTNFCTVTRITSQWKKTEIPLNRFGNPQLLKNMKELVITFAPNTVSEGREKGTIYIDNIFVE